MKTKKIDYAFSPWVIRKALDVVQIFFCFRTSFVSFFSAAAHLFIWGRWVIVLLQIGSWCLLWLFKISIKTFSNNHFEPFLQDFIALFFSANKRIILIYTSNRFMSKRFNDSQVTEASEATFDKGKKSFQWLSKFGDCVLNTFLDWGRFKESVVGWLWV